MSLDEKLQLHKKYLKNSRSECLTLSDLSWNKKNIAEITQNKTHADTIVTTLPYTGNEID